MARRLRRGFRHAPFAAGRPKIVGEASHGAARFTGWPGACPKVKIPRNTGDFRLMDRRVVDAIKQLPERTRFMKGLFAWVGFKHTRRSCTTAEPRHAGTTKKWNYWRLWNFGLDGILFVQFAAAESLELNTWACFCRASPFSTRCF